jgi:anti-sigma factor RsiW
MNCDETGVLLHALLDNELDAGHAREVELHLACCPRCAGVLRRQREMRRMLAAADLRCRPPAALRQRIDDALGVRRQVAPSRRSLLRGFAMGSLASAAAAASVVVFLAREDQEQRLLGDAVSAHLRSLQAEHLTDVQTSDQHTVKPWFNGRLDIAPPVIDLTAQGFTLIGGRLDYLDGRPVAAIVYKRRAHVINLFVVQAVGSARTTPRSTSVQGFNARQWGDQDLDFLAISDLASDELQEFGEKFEEGHRAGRSA